MQPLPPQMRLPNVAQSQVWLQLSVRLPPQRPAQSWPGVWVGAQPHWFAVTAPQVCGAAQVIPPLPALHATTVPQLLVTLPHLPEQVVATDCATQPHWLAVTALQV